MLSDASVALPPSPAYAFCPLPAMVVVVARSQIETSHTLVVEIAEVERPIGADDQPVRDC